MTGRCWECDAEGHVEQHHVVPVVSGGTRTVPLCPSCHGKVHGTNRLHHAELVKRGVRSRWEQGKHHGRPTYGWAYDPETGALVENEEQQAVLRIANDLYARTKGGWPAVAALLNDGGLFTENSVPWTAQNLRMRVRSDQRARARYTG